MLKNCDIGGVSSSNETVGVGGVSNNNDTEGVSVGNSIQSLTLGGEDGSVGLQQVTTLHSLGSGASTN